MITHEQRSTLADIFANTEAIDKMTLRLDATTRTITVVYDDLDDEWFRELASLDRGDGT